MPTAEDCERNKKNVIMAAYRCYLHCGIEGATQKDIAREAKLTPRSIQRYFCNRDELVLAVAKYMLSEYNNSVKEYVLQKCPVNMNALEELGLFLECQKKIYLENEGIFLLMNELDIYFKRYKQRYLFAMPELKRLDAMRPYLYSILQRGIHEGCIYISGDVTDRVELIIATYTGLFQHFNSKYLVTSGHCRENDIGMFDLYIHGLKNFLSVPV